MNARDQGLTDANALGHGADTCAVSFERLLEPVSLENFFSEVCGRRPLHVPGRSDKFGDLFSWAEFNRLLNMSKLWSDRCMKMVLDGGEVPPESYSVSGMTREGTQALLPESPKVEALLRRGATLILDLVETLTPGIAEITRALTAATGSVVVCNAYCSFKAHQGFLSHFDTTDVYVLHIAGSKVWRVYEGVAEHPVDMPGYNWSSLTPAERSSTRGSLAMEIEMTPGDLLYLPRGQYHEALASSDASLHLSFGANRATGLDFVSRCLISMTLRHCTSICTTSVRRCGAGRSHRRSPPGCWSGGKPGLFATAFTNSTCPAWQRTRAFTCAGLASVWTTLQRAQF